MLNRAGYRWGLALLFLGLFGFVAGCDDATESDADLVEDQTAEVADLAVDSEDLGEDARDEGGAGEPCFSDGRCDDGLRCWEGLCEAAGGLEERCQDDGSCDENLICFSEICVLPLVAPHDLVATPADQEIVLRWAHEDAEAFEVLRRSEEEADFEVLASVDAGFSYVDVDIELGATYFYAVRAVDGARHSDLSEVVSSASLMEAAQWTLLYFISSDGNYGYDYWFNIDGLEAQGGSTDEIHVLVLYDGFEVGDSRYYRVGATSEETQAFEIPTAPGGEVDMGEISTYLDFVDWAQANYPAEHLFASFHDHGGGSADPAGAETSLKSMLYDETSGDSLDPDEQGAVIAHMAEKARRPVELVESMTCLGQMIENTYGMAGAARYHLGAESLSYVSGTFPLSFLKANPESTGLELGLFMAEHHHQGNLAMGQPCHWSLIDLDSLPSLAEELGGLAGALSDFATGPEAQALIRDVVAEAQNFHLYPNDKLSAYVDIKDLALALRDASSLPTEVQGAAEEVIAAFDAMVVYNDITAGTHPGLRISPDYSGAYGLSIYHPNAQMPFYEEAALPPYESLAFSVETGWGEYLQAISLEAPTGPCAPVSDLEAELLDDGRVRIHWTYPVEEELFYDVFFCSRDKDGVFTGEYQTLYKVPGQSAYETLDAPVEPGTYTWRVSPYRVGDDGSVSWSQTQPLAIK